MPPNLFQTVFICRTLPLNTTGPICSDVRPCPHGRAELAPGTTPPGATFPVSAQFRGHEREARCPRTADVGSARRRNTRWFSPLEFRIGTWTRSSVSRTFHHAPRDGPGSSLAFPASPTHDWLHQSGSVPAAIRRDTWEPPHASEQCRGAVGTRGGLHRAQPQRSAGARRLPIASLGGKYFPLYCNTLQHEAFTVNTDSVHG